VYSFIKHVPSSNLGYFPVYVVVILIYYMLCVIEIWLARVVSQIWL
jgi:ABC-type amino acid transport system permease subunit